MDLHVKGLGKLSDDDWQEIKEIQKDMPKIYYEPDFDYLD